MRPIALCLLGLSFVLGNCGGLVDSGNKEVQGTQVQKQVRESRGVSFANQVQPIFNESCASFFCHGGPFAGEGLRLDTGNAYQDLVNVASKGCPSNLLVKPSAPEESYLVFKIEGTGPCFEGDPMPIMGSLSAEEIKTIRTWISEGALDN